jgi:hypothetical protein
VSRDADGFVLEEQFQIVQCQGCDLVSFREDFQSTDELVAALDGQQVPARHERLYPPRVVGRATLAHARLLPTSVRQIYSETHAALCNQLPILATVGIRTLIEAVCLEKGAAGGSLAAKVDDLMRLGVLTPSARELLHRIREFGNISAHEVKPLGSEALSTSFAVVENLLQSVYIFPMVLTKATRPRRRLPTRKGQKKPGSTD